MQYFVFTTKHHDGFSMFDTKQTDYPHHRPATAVQHATRAPDVAQAVSTRSAKQGFGIGAYFSKADWHNPDYWSPDAPARTRNPNYDTRANPEKWARFVDVRPRPDRGADHRLRPDRHPVAGRGAGPPAEAGHPHGRAGRHGAQPPAGSDRGGPHRRRGARELPHAGAGGARRSRFLPVGDVHDDGDQWSYKPDDHYKSPRKLVHLLVDVVAKGGNFLLNVGPQPDGRLPAPALERMKEIGVVAER